MSESKLCRLCLTFCYDGKGLYDDSEVFEITTKYFDPMFLKLKEHLTVVCFECWCHLVDFHNFQERILQAQSTFIEREVVTKPNDDVVTVESSSSSDDEGDIEDDPEFVALSDDQSEIPFTAHAANTSKSTITNPTQSVGPEPILECVVCRLSYATLKELRSHFRQEHPEMKFIFYCCQIKFDMNQCKYREHLRLHANPNAFRCNLCEATFKWKGTLKNHLCLKKAKSQANGGFVCKECGLTTALSSQLRNHVYKVHTKRNFKCTLCPKAYTARSSLDEHMSVHTGAYPFVCQQCPLKFRYRSLLRNHVIQNHDI